MESVEKMESELIVFMCPHCHAPYPDLPKHLLIHGYKMCNACETNISEKRSFKWKKDGGALKAHWTSRHKTDFKYCELKNCIFPLTPIGTTHVCKYD
ncbi:hypothetical protein M0R45_010942 [Rubus argutus]|uniref:C2H2-type domain-containing protein n=1 Tax=Rubus argutus TaxID=59490 RepID=A0AAW1Y8J6_RUBAR